METRPRDFSVVSKGYCFLCLDKISAQFDIGSSSVNSFHDISRYLKMDMRKVFIQGGPVPPHLLEKVQRARLKVELCEECSYMTETISKRCRQLEKLKMEIETGLESIHEKMTNAEKAGKAEHFQKLVGSEGVSGMGDLLDILKVLRKETVQKCSRKISQVSPRLKVQRLSADEIRRKTFRMHKTKAESPQERMLDSGFQHRNIKMEEPVNVDWPLEDANQSCSPFMADEMDHSIPTHSIKNEDEPAEGRVTSDDVIRRKEAKTDGNTKRKPIFNPETGKYKCQLCQVEYGSKNGVYHHYDAVHRKISVECKLCGKSFTKQSDYKIHHESVHLGIRFQCKVCQKTFSQKRVLIAHQRKAGCATT